VAIVGEAPSRKVVALCSLQRGDAILQEVPTVTLLNPKQWGSRCNHCFVKPTSSALQRCSRCKRFWFCSKTCQQKEWKYHKEECSAMSTGRSSIDESLLADSLLAARVFRLSKTDPEKFQSVTDLIFHTECIRPSHHEVATAVMEMELLNPEIMANTSHQQIVEMLARFDSNNFGIVDELLFFQGAGVYPAGAMLNHSCEPNCAIFYASSSNTMVIKCITDVGKGEELCHSFLDGASLSFIRREKLKSTYGFDCQCTRCIDETGKWAEVDKLLDAPLDGVNPSTAKRVIAETETLLQQAAMEEAIEEELRLLQRCVAARAKVLHPLHMALYLARSQLHTTAVAAGYLALATEQCAEILVTMETCFYRAEHPMIGIMQYTLGSLHHSLNCFQKAIACYEKALAGLDSFHGREHSLTIGCRDYLLQALQEAGEH
jgi:[histone H3]-lysine4/36 N-trimethyltransferase SMYD